MFRPRPKQQEVLNYTGGKMGVSAVPGSGKTQTLSYLAAQLVADGFLMDEQEVLVVTLVNSAVDNFASRVASLVQERGLLPHVGYRVRTLHGLANDIVRERPDLAGLSDGFQIIDDREEEQILRDAVETWLTTHGNTAEYYLSPDSDEQAGAVGKRSRHWHDLVVEIAGAFVKQAKDMEYTPGDIRRNLGLLPDPLPLLEMGCEIYADYQRALAYRGAVDFADLIRLALRAVQSDSSYLARLQRRWPYILEDEAQDSSRLQEKILRLLVGPTGNWVRVGDPNQAIYETFTTASPQFLRDFLRERGVQARDLPNSGRCTKSIIDLANHLVQWTRADHPVEGVRDALVAPPLILPTAAGDPQPNPPDDPGAVRLIGRAYTVEEEVKAVVDSIARWLPTHPDRTIAVLVPRNERGLDVVGTLKRAGLDCVELLRSSGSARDAVRALANIVGYLADPQQPAKLASACSAWCRGEEDDLDAVARQKALESALRKCIHTEDFLWPRAGGDWLDSHTLVGLDGRVREQLLAFRDRLRRWQSATLMPVDQLVLTLGQDLFESPVELALCHRLAVVLDQIGQSHPDWRLPDFARELDSIARKGHKSLRLSDDATGFDPEEHRGKVVVATIHKAKGLEWDRVYLMSLNNYDFPSAQPHDSFISEKWFVRGHLNLVAETLAQLKATFSADMLAPYLPEGEATQRARHEYAGERLRLLYVGITRARRELIMTWNTGRGRQAQEAAPLIALRTWWEEQEHHAVR